MPAHIINEGIVSGGMFIAIGKSIIARVAAQGGISALVLPLVQKPPINRYMYSTDWHGQRGHFWVKKSID